MATPDHYKTHSLMRLQAYGGMVVLQPYEEGGVVGRSLTIDLQTGTLALGDAVDQIKVGYVTVYGIMGMVKVHTGCVLIVATGAEQVRPVTTSLVLQQTCMQTTFVAVTCVDQIICYKVPIGWLKYTLAAHCW